MQESSGLDIDHALLGALLDSVKVTDADLKTKAVSILPLFKLSWLYLFVDLSLKKFRPPFFWGGVSSHLLARRLALTSAPWPSTHLFNEEEEEEEKEEEEEEEEEVKAT